MVILLSLIHFEKHVVVVLGPTASLEITHQETTLSKMGKGKILKLGNFALFSINFFSFQAL